MFAISAMPVQIFLDFNAVIVNLESLPPQKQKACVAQIQEKVGILKFYLEENLREKEHAPNIPAAGMAVLRQQYALAETIEKWIHSLDL